MIGFIVNPVSGNGRGAKVWRVLEASLRQRGIKYEVKFTEHAGEAPKLAEVMASAEHIQVVAAVGGDGTVHEVANGLIAAGARCLLGYIPAGSGNDFARGHGLPLTEQDALERILSSERQTACIDVLQLRNDRYPSPTVSRNSAVSSIGAGLDGQIAKVTNEAGYKKWLNRLRLGKLAYVISLVRVLASYRPSDVTVTVDETTHHYSNVWLIAAANIPFYGGGMMICPDAAPNDGLADVCIVSGISRWKLLRLFPLVYEGNHTMQPCVTMLRGRHISIESEASLFVHMDGEQAANTPLEITVAAQALHIVR